MATKIQVVVYSMYGHIYRMAEDGRPIPKRGCSTWTRSPAARPTACTSMTIASYARRKQWPLESVTVRLRHARIHAVDCRDCETKEGMVARIEREIALSGLLTEEQRARLLEIANKCPAHRTLTSEIRIESWLAE